MNNNEQQAKLWTKIAVLALRVLLRVCKNLKLHHIRNGTPAQAEIFDNFLPQVVDMIETIEPTINQP